MGLLKDLGIGKYLKKVKDYTDEQIENLVGTAPETLDTIYELAEAIKDNDTIIDALNGAITDKASKSELNTEIAKIEEIIVDNEKVTAGAIVTINKALNDKASKSDLEDIIISGGGASIIEITYTDLKSLRDKGELVPSQQYRIIDYVTTTVQVNTQSAGHQFDVIVTADDVNVLNENARAIQHEEDTYFSNSDLNAWKLKYCLDNDTNRFAWADATNGKGVIYYMKDEFNNECPYDFKNIQFRHPNDTDTYPDYYYTFSIFKQEQCYDKTTTIVDVYSGDYGKCHGNIIKPYTINSENIKYNLNFIIFLNESEYGDCYGNSFGDNCYHNSFGSNCYTNSFGVGCRYNSFGVGCYDNSFGNYCTYNSFGVGCYGNSFGNYCSDNSFGNSCYDNSFGNYCSDNSFGNYCSDNSFGNSCSDNSFRTNNSITATLLNYCRYNHFDDGCSYNIVYNTTTTGSNNQLQNININRGVSGTYSKHNTISIDTLNANYEIQVAKNSSGTIKIYCEADLIA